MVAVVFLQMVRVFLTAAYKNGRATNQNRPVNWIVGVVLLLVTLFLFFTGYLLPWDQLAYWAITVGTSIASAAPVVGDWMRFILLGGSDAPILLLDEPTVSLDPEGAIRFREFLAMLKAEGKTIVFSSHVLADVERLADRVAILVDGKLVAIESIGALREELMRSCRMRIVMANPDEQWIAAAREAGASEALLEGGSLLVASRAEDRMNVLRAIETAGVLRQRV